MVVGVFLLTGICLGEQQQVKIMIQIALKNANGMAKDSVKAPSANMKFNMILFVFPSHQ